MLVRKILGIFTILIAVSGAQYAHAQKSLGSYGKPMPNFVLMSQDEFKQATYEDAYDSDINPSLSYKIRLPKGWEKVSGADPENDGSVLSSKVFGELGSYVGPARVVSERSRLTVDALDLDYKVSAEQWLIQYVSDNSYPLEGVDVISDREAEVLYIILERDLSYIVRARVVVNGKKLFFIRYYLPVENWEDERIIQAQVMGSFTSLNEIDEAVEESKTFKFLDIAEVAYPISWQVRSSPFRSLDYMEADFLNVPGVGGDAGRYEQLTLDGKITIRLVSAFVVDALENEIKSFKDSLEETGLVLGEEIEGDDVDYNAADYFDFVKTNVYQAVNNEKNLLNYETWITLMAAGDYYYFISLLSPSRDDQYNTWVRNTQTYQFIIEGISLNKDSVVQR